MSRRIEIAFYMLMAVLFLPLIGLLSPFIWLTRRSSRRRSVKVGLAVSGRWPDNLQYARFPYDVALFRAGAQVVTVKPSDIDDLRRKIEKLDALLLTGGEDIDPQLYDAPKHLANFINSARDELEMELLNLAAEMDIPLLAVCRGSQLLAVKYGGHLVNIEDEDDIHSFRLTNMIKFTGHHVDIVPESRLAKIFPAPELVTNSIHHQSIADAGTLNVSARSKDGCIEGVEHPEYDFMIGVQWHPELRALFESANQGLFNALVEAAAKRKREQDKGQT